MEVLIFRITLQGFPTARLFAGMDLVTTLPAPITLPRPIVTPGRIMTPPPTTVLNGNRQGIRVTDICCSVLCFCWCQPLIQFNRVGSRIDLHIGGYQYIVADNDFVAVHKGASGVYADIVTYADVAAIITDERMSY